MRENANGINELQEKFIALDDELKHKLLKKLVGKIQLIIKRNEKKYAALSHSKIDRFLSEMIDIYPVGNKEIVINLKKDKVDKNNNGYATYRQAKTLLKLGYKLRVAGKGLTNVSFNWLISHMSEAQAGAIIGSMMRKQGIQKTKYLKDSGALKIRKNELVGNLIYKDLNEIEDFLNAEIQKLT